MLCVGQFVYGGFSVGKSLGGRPAHRRLMRSLGAALGRSNDGAIPGNLAATSLWLRGSLLRHLPARYPAPFV